MKRIPDGCWAEATSSRLVGEDKTPRTFEIWLGKLRVVVTRHIHYPGQWIMKCEPFVIVAELGDIDAEAAKSAAIRIIRAKLLASLKATETGS